MINQYMVMYGWDRWLLSGSWQQFAAFRSVFDAILVAAAVAEFYFLYDDSRALDIVL